MKIKVLQVAHAFAVPSKAESVFTEQEYDIDKEGEEFRIRNKRPHEQTGKHAEKFTSLANAICWTASEKQEGEDGAGAARKSAGRSAKA